jgi:hypothetical protein
VVQLTHWPSLHTWLLPHALPFGATPVSTQTGAPVVQAILPALHVSGRSQGMSATQATHSPVALQTLSVPQLSPGGRARALSLQTGTAPAQSRVPSWQGFMGRQLPPVMQVVQAPS